MFHVKHYELVSEGLIDWLKKVMGNNPQTARVPNTRLMKVNSYGSGLRRGIYGLWSGKIDAQDAFIHMWTIIERGIMMAWYAGAAECGVYPDELSQSEINALQDTIYTELNYLEKLIYNVMDKNKESGTKLSYWNSRLIMWTNRYNAARNRAKMLACGDKKLKWVLGPTKDHCVDCAKLNGKVKRASFWAASGWQPQGRMLACEGYNCLCALVVTTERMTPGKLPVSGGE